MLYCVLLAAILTAAQDIDPKEDVTLQMYSGTVTDMDKDKVTVSRAVPGKPAEKRTFVLKPETKIEGKLKARVRVTVGYVSKDEGDVAMRIIVRSSAAPAPAPPPPAPPKT